MKELRRLIPAVLIGAVLGYVLVVGYRCVESWSLGGTPDPRCVYGLKGYYEVHRLGKTRELDRVTCEYRQEVGR